MIILGIDPGIGRMGWGIVEVHGAQCKAQSFGCVETSKDASIGERLTILYDELVNIIKEFNPEALAVEELFFNTNVTTALIVGQARGIVFLAAQQHNLSIAVYTPLEVKMGVTGYGRADKNQVGHMVKSILKLHEIPKPDDTADALAIALTHAFSYKLKK